MKKMKSLLATGLAAIMAISMTACGGSATSSSQSTAGSTDTGTAEASDAASGDLDSFTVYAINDPQMSAAYYVAMDQGYFKEEGLDPQTEVVPSGPDLASFVAKGQDIIAMGTTYNLFSWLENDVPIKLVLPLVDIGGTQDSAIRAGLDINPDNAKDILTGAKVGMVTGAEAYLPLEKLCEQYGVDIKSMQFVNLSASEQTAALSTGEIDIMACWEPFVTNAVKQGSSYLCSGSKDFVADHDNGADVNWGHFYTGLEASEDVIENHADRLQKMCKALDKATEYINSNRDDAVKILAPIYEMDEDLLAIIMNENSYQTNADDDFVSGTDTIAEYAVEAKVTTKEFKPADYADWSIMQAALPEKVTVE